MAASTDDPLIGSGITVTVAVPTFRRPALLARLLEEIDSQARELDARTGGLTVLLVADNDPDASAESVVAGRPGVQYLQVAEPGIAAVRGACLRAATGDVLQFIDDDEEPAPDWLATMVGSWLALGRPDALAGSVLPKFHSQPSDWVRAGGFFDRRRPPTGTDLPAAPAGNLLLSLAGVRRLGVTFDAALGLRGGEDTLFTRQLSAAGGRIRFCREGIIFDLVPDDRNTREWVLRRAWHHGNTTSVVALWGLRGARRQAVRARLALGGVARVSAGAATAGIGTLTRLVAWNARGCRLAHRGRGMLAGASGTTPPEYVRQDVGSS